MPERQSAGVGRKMQLAVIGAALLSLAGCASRTQIVPDTAVLRAQGDDRVVYVAESPGNVWVTTKDENNVVYSGRLGTGDRLVLDSKDNLLTVNDRAVVTKELPRRDYKIFFDEGLSVPAASRVGDRDARVEVKRPDSVPMSAMLVGEGNDRVEYTAADDGEVWIVNSDRNTLVYGGRVDRGEQVVIDPKDDRLLIGSRTGLADRANLPDDNYRIFFARSIDRPAAVLPASPGTVTVRPSDPVIVRTREPAVVVEPRAVERPLLDRPTDIPTGAIVWSDTRERTNLTATDAGRAWVVDDSNRILYTTRIARGDTLSIDPDNDRMTLNGNRAYDGRLTPGRYRVYFERIGR